MRRTKIVCTIGPASSKRAVLEKLLRAGMNVARLNFSHGRHEDHAEAIANLRDLSGKMGRPLALLQDLSGPKVRLGSFETPLYTLKRGQIVGLTDGPIPVHAHPHVPPPDDDLPPDADDCTPACIVLPLPIAPLLDALTPGRTLLLDDGKLSLRVVQIDRHSETGERIVWTRCTMGGDIKPKKGVAAPGVRFQVPAVTEKDLDDLRFGLAQGVDWVAASYVRSADDLEPLKRVMAEVGTSARLIAKIEKFEAVKDFDSILQAVDAIMVARGDLGVEMPFDEVPIVQKRLIKACNRAGKPVITATQMLESMIQNPRPTRAEATDVANAILDGTDAVMLSGETAAGEFPVEAVQTMAKIAERAETAFFAEDTYHTRLGEPDDVTGAMARASADIACQLKAAAILCATTSGSTARKVAQYRPWVPIIGATPELSTYRQLALSWGVTPYLLGRVQDTDQMMQVTLDAVQQTKMARPGDRVVITAGIPVNNPGSTNVIKVHIVGQPLYPNEQSSENGLAAPTQVTDNNSTGI